MSNETPPGWAERRLKEAIELDLTLSGHIAISTLSVLSRLFRFVPPKIDIEVILRPLVHMIDVEIEINFNKETDSHE